MSTVPLIVENELNASVATVWKAISDRNEMKLWYFDLAAFEPRVGFEFEFMGGTETNQYRHICQITEVEVEQKLTYSWAYDGYEGSSFVTFELEPRGEKTFIRLTHRGLETFPPNRDFARSNFEEGWSAIIGKMLPEYLENKV